MEVSCNTSRYLYFPGVGVVRSTQSEALFVSLVSEPRASECPYGTTTALGLKMDVFVPHEPASTIAPEAFLRTTRSPPFASPLPMELPSEMNESVGMPQSVRVVDVAAITRDLPGETMMPCGIVSNVNESSTFQPPTLTAACVPLYISIHSFVGFVPWAVSTA